jgi:DNA primase catalytic core
MNDFDEVKTRTDILELVRTETTGDIKKIGINIYNLKECPFCGGHECFRINSAQQYFNCFQCDAGGNVFNFIQLIKQLSPYEALKELAGRADYNIENSKPVSDALVIRQEIFSKAADFYHNKLLKAKKAQAWLSDRRGHTLKTIEEFKIGFTGGTGAALFNHLKDDYTNEQLTASGLIKKNHSDFLPRHVYIYPHFVHGKVSHFTFKDPKKKLQYQLPNEYKLNDHLFYGQNAFYHDTVVLVEGENDRITVVRISGEKNIAGTGGQIGQAQIDLLKRACRGKKIYCCFDADPAGDKYTAKLINELTGIAQVWVMRFPDGKDIDEYLRGVKEDPREKYYELLENAIDGLHFQIESLPPSDDTIKIGQMLNPVLERMARIDDDLRVAGYLEIIQKKYPKSVIRTALKSRMKSLKTERQIELAGRKDVPKDDYGLIEHNNEYFRKSTEGATINLGNFVLNLRKIFVEDEELHYECILKNIKNETSLPLIFYPDERAGLVRFREKCVSKGSFYYRGTQLDLYRIWQYEEDRANIKEIIHYIQKYGYIAEHALWLYGDCAIKNGKKYDINQDGIIKIENKGFKSKDVLVYSGDTPTIGQETVDENFKLEVIRNFHLMFDGDNEKSYKGYLALGFVAATIYLNEIAKTFKCFPIFFPYGPSGTGKSHATALLLNFFGFDGRAEDWASATPDGTYKFMEQLSCLPAWYDEFANATDRKFRNMLGVVKNIYNRIGAGKGGLRKRQINIVNGALWISGEDSPQDKGLLSRCVIMRFTEITDIKTSAWKWLGQQQSRLPAILVDLIKSKNKTEVENLIEGIRKFRDHIKANGVSDDRTATNYAIAAASFWLFGHHGDDEAYMAFVVSEAKKDKIRKEEEDILITFFNDVSYMINKRITINTVFVDGTNLRMYMCFNEVYKDWIIMLRNQGTLQRFKQTTILDYLRTEKYFIDLHQTSGDNRVWFGDQRKRAIAFDLKKMPLEIREHFETGKKDEF